MATSNRRTGRRRTGTGEQFPFVGSMYRTMEELIGPQSGDDTNPTVSTDDTEQEAQVVVDQPQQRPHGTQPYRTMEELIGPQSSEDEEQEDDNQPQLPQVVVADDRNRGPLYRTMEELMGPQSDEEEMMVEQEQRQAPPPYRTMEELMGPQSDDEEEQEQTSADQDAEQPLDESMSEHSNQPSPTVAPQPTAARSVLGSIRIGVPNPPLILKATPMPAVVTRLDALVAVPEMERRTFDSWEEFHQYLLDYGQETYQLYSVRSATPSSRRNALLSKKRGSPTSQLIPERFAHYVKTITCTHGGKPRNRSKGARPNHHHRAIECPAQINACVKKVAHGWQIQVTNQYAWHNHGVTAAIYKTYPEVRNALGADVLATVNILRKAEAKRKKILEYIIENTPHQPKMKDVHNLLSKLKRDEAQRS